MKEIYVFGVFTGCSSYGIIRDAEPCGDVVGYAVDRLVEEDGETKLGVVASHFSSGEHWCMHDMGITSNWNHDIYKSMYPDGYELVWLGCFGSDKEAYDAAMERLA